MLISTKGRYALRVMIELAGSPRDEYRPVNAAPWEADEVYRLYHSGEPSNQFLVCWPGRMAEVNFDWDWAVTEGMMSSAAEALKTA